VEVASPPGRKARIGGIVKKRLSEAEASVPLSLEMVGEDRPVIDADYLLGKIGVEAAS
jgi:hypothetical protein